MLEALRQALPEREWRALSAWLTTFYPYQLEWILDWSRFAYCVKARQIGASHSYAAAAMIWGLLGETSTAISVGEREADEVVLKSRLHAEALVRLGSDWARPVRASRSTLILGSGGRIISLPATSGGRGYSGNVILDEFAYHQHPEKVWDAASGAVMHGFRLRVLSTPNGIGNLFHELCTSPRANAGYRRHAVVLDEARLQGLRVNDEECWKMARGDPRVFDQLFRCSFLDNEAQYIPSSLIDAATSDEPAPRDGDVYAGLDVGRSANLTALVILRMCARVLWTITVETKGRTSLEDIDHLVGLAVGTYGARRICIDATGMGTFPAEAMQKKHGLHRVEPVNFTQQVKEDLATGLYQHFATSRLRLRRADAATRDDVRSIRRIITTAGNVRYDAPNTEQGHADRAWALALAVHAASKPSSHRHEVLDYDEDSSDE